MFGYSYPNTGINQSHLANELRYFILEYGNGNDVTKIRKNFGQLDKVTAHVC